MNYNNEFVEKFRRERNKWLKKFFSNSGIKTNFIIEILRTIEKEHAIDYFKWFDLPNDNEKIVTMNFDNPEYEICRHIIGVYKSITLFKSIEERKKLEDNQTFKKQLINEVIFRLNLNKYSKGVFRKKQLFCGDSYIDFSVPYYVFTICAYLLSKLDKNNIYNGLRWSIIQNAFAMLDLLENNIIDVAYPIGRGMIETYVKYLCLIGKPEALEMRNNLAKEEISHNVCNNDFSKEFENMYNIRKGTTKNRLHFLHYGFVDKITDYYDIIENEKAPYSVNAMFAYIKKTTKWDKKEDIDDLERYYYMCHTYVHGNCSNMYPLNGYLELSAILYVIVADMFKTICNELKTNYLIDGLDIMTHVELAYSQLQEQIEKRSTELFVQYYKM